MDKTAIKTFAIEARKQLIADVSYLAEGLGISKDKIVAASVPAPGIEKITLESGEIVTLQDTKIKQRHSLLSRIEEVGYDQVIEEAAYTWFNRLIAVRFMEVHGYLPIRVLSSSTGKEESDLIAQAPDVDFGFTSEQISKIYELKDRNKIDELFKILFIRQCNVLNDALPGMFQKTEDYTELLFPLQYTNPNGVIKHLLNDIPEQDFLEAVEIIGWLYQEYISVRKDELINARKQYKNPDIPFVTQLFTSDWIVRYMVENSLGRYWIDRHPEDADLKQNWSFYLDEAEQKPEVKAELLKIYSADRSASPEDIKVIDPCMGSGHILVYAFDVLMQIYLKRGYQQSNAARLILEKNLYGLDIDNRAYQLSYFALTMKAREYDSHLFTHGIKPNVYSFQRLSHIDPENLSGKLQEFASQFKNCEMIGSLLKLKNFDVAEVAGLISGFTGNLLTLDYKPILSEMLAVYSLLVQKYDVVVTNPPYMNSSYMPPLLKTFVADNYADYKSDLFSAFMMWITSICKEHGHIGLLTPYVWMFISSYEKLRAMILSQTRFTSLTQLEYNAFEGACVPVCTFTLRYDGIGTSGEFIKLSDFKGSENQAPKTLEAISNRDCGYRHSSYQENFSKIPGSPIAYWVSENFISTFDKGISISSISDITGSQNKTADNTKYLRRHWEVNSKFVGKTNHWVFYQKGGDYRKHYGNLDLVVDWSEDARYYYKTNPTSNLLDEKYWYQEGITYTMLTSRGSNFRYMEPQCIFDMGGPAICYLNEKTPYVLAFLNSTITNEILKVLNPTINLQIKDLKALPLIIDERNSDYISNLEKENIAISKRDWDSFETSWDFQQHPFLTHKGTTVEESFKNWQSFAEQQFKQLKTNEEELNRIFIEIYGLQDELTPEEEDKDVTIRKADLQRDVKSYLSYAVGCMFGRYSLDTPGLVYAGGDFDPAKYISFPADNDGIIPITDREYFEDDIVGRFIEFLKVTYGENTLEENLAFIAGALKTKGNTPRESIRNYFLKEFYADHLKIYQKRPIYWLFDSGKENGFKALVYLHRYNRDTVGRVRTDYLHEMQKKIEAAIQRAEYFKTNGNTPAQQRKALDEISTLTKQLEETKKYDEALATIALKRIELDLDDGVKVNYEKFQNVDVGGEGKMKKTIDLLGKIK